MANVTDGPLQACATLSDKLPKDEIKIPGTHPTAGRAGIDAEIWKTYVSEASDHDKNLVASWNEDLDVLLIFAGLFSAVLTAFIIESRKDLQEDYQKTSADLLHILVDQPLNRTAPTIRPFEVASSVIRVNMLWFSSLACSLISALGAMLGKQWVRQYTNHLSGGGAHLLRARRHQAALLAAKQWRMSGVIMTIPILMHLSLFLFFVGLSIFLSDDNAIIVRTIMVISIVGILSYAVITVLPSIYQHCPFGTPFSRFLPLFYSTFREDHDGDQHSVSDLDAKCLTWLMTYTTSTPIAHSAAMAVSGLACTPSQQDILFKGGGVSILIKALASCTVEENGSLSIRRESLDTASLLLFGAQSLLNMPGSRFAQNDDYENLNKLLKKFNSNKFLDIRSNFDAADSAAAMWCILAHHSLSLGDPNNSNELVSRLQKIPTSFEVPAAHRAYKELLTPCMYLVLSAQNDPVLCSWAVKRMFDFWKFEGCPSLGKTGAQILLRALMGASQTLGLIASKTGGVDDITSFGGVDTVIQGLALLKGNADAQQHVVNILHKIVTSSNRNKATIFSAIGQFIQIFPSLEGNTDAQGTMGEILSGVSFRDQSLDAISSAVGPLIQALRSLKGNTNVQITIANMLHEISSSDCSIDTISSAVGPLIEALPSVEGNIDVQMAVADTMNKISSRNCGINDISNAGFGQLIQALAPLHDSVQESITKTIANISSSDCGVNAIISGKGVEPLIEALTLFLDSQAGYHIAITLAQISSSDRGVDAIISGAGVGSLIQAFASLPHSSARTHVATTLARISTRSCGVVAISKTGVGPLIKAVMSLECGTYFRRIVINILGKILSSDDGNDVVCESGAVGQLIRASTSLKCDINARRVVIEIIDEILSNDQDIDAICESSAIGQLVKTLALFSLDPNTGYYVAETLAPISTSDRIVNAFISGTSVGLLIRVLLYHGDSYVQTHLATTLARISSSKRGIDAISSVGVGPLIKASTSLKYSASIRKIVADILDKICSTYHGIDAISGSHAGAGPFIQSLILLDDSDQENITKILFKMSTNHRGVDAIISGVGPFIKALMSKPGHLSRRPEQQEIQTKSIVLLCRISMIFRRSALQGSNDS